MRIAMFSNTFRPMLGGIENSVATFAEDFRLHGHECLVVTPEMNGAEESSSQVLRVPAVKRIGGSSFSLQWPVPGYVTSRVDDFSPDVVHSHHPFLMGDSALRNAWRLGVPLVMTYHTLWDRYADSMGTDTFKNIVVNLSVEYANACDCVVAPSKSLADMIATLGVKAPVEVIPTGIDIPLFSRGSRENGRARMRIPKDAHVAGYVGRVGPEKNLAWLAQAAVMWCAADPKSLFAVVGPSENFGPVIRSVFDKAGLAGRLLLPGPFQGAELADAYAALDVFTFASLSDTQGIVLAEAMAAGLPIVAIDAPGAREAVADGVNGTLLPHDVSHEAYAAALAEIFSDGPRNDAMRKAACERSRAYDRTITASSMLSLYASLVEKSRRSDCKRGHYGPVRRAAGRICAEQKLFASKFKAMADALCSLSRP